ncbi:MAG: ectonucleotide pyrophosphatase/phosphodiesterase [Candidatus Longimicrobiales bacterium M2_2A_002]
MFTSLRDLRAGHGTRTTTLAAVLALALATAAACGTNATETSERQPAPDTSSIVVMVSFDGMHDDFVDRTTTPAFERIADAGVRADGLIPVYPSKTFPNHYAIATGLYASNHGLVDNTFYDPAFDAVYSIGNRDAVRDGRWYGGEPIWVTAERQGVRAASYFWVGTEAPIEGVQPTYFKYYDEDVPYAARVDTVLHWLALPASERPRLVMLYFDEPDWTAHRNGPDAAAVDSTVRVLDGHLGRLLDGLEALPIADRITVVLVSDHGMREAPAGNVIVLDDHADLEGVRVLYTATQAKLYFGGDSARVEELYQSLRDGLPEHATVYRPAGTPERWHYDHGARIGDLIVAADPGWIVRSRDSRPWPGGGTHGWDPADPAMHGIFLAAGPGIREGARIPAFENVNIYPFVARLLGLEPAAEIDGRLDVLEPALTGAGATP